MSSRPGVPAWMRVIAAAVLTVHGAIHVMVFLLLWEISEFGELTYADTSSTPGTTAARLVGIVWLVAAAVFVAAGLLLWRGRPAWRAAAVGGCVLSIPVLIPVADAAAAGLVLDLVILVMALIGYRIHVPLGSRT